MGYKQEQVKPYGQEGTKGEQVERMFDNIAPTYDKLNHRLSFSIDRLWRNRAISFLKKKQPRTILDIATGTGDFAILAAERIKPERVVGADISEGMMAIGREKVRRKGLEDVVRFEKEDCLALSYPTGQFDAVTATFGIRNFQELDRGLAEMHRVLRPGGVLCVLEMSSPTVFPMKQLFRLYSHTLLPFYGRLISKDTEAYDYLIRSIEAFPQGEEMMAILRKAGFRNPSFQRLTFGICTIYTAEK